MSRLRLAIALVVAVLLVAGCAAAGASPSSAPASSGVASSESTGPTDVNGTSDATDQVARHVAIAAGAATFDIPASWHTRQGTINPGGNWTVVFMSPQVLPGECTQDAQVGVCYSWPVTRLVPGGTVFAWRMYGRPGFQPPADGEPIAVGGRPARISYRAAEPACAAIGGDVSVAVVIAARPGESAWTGIDACQAGPDHRVADAAFRQLLAGVTWHPS